MTGGCPAGESRCFVARGSGTVEGVREVEFERAERNARVRLAWLAGESVAVVAARVGLTVGMVWGIVNSTPGLVAERARRDAQAARREARAAAKAEALVQAAALAWSRDHLGVPLPQGAAVLGVTPDRLRELLGPRESLHPSRPPKARRYTDEAILQRLREWGTVHGLNGSAYRLAAQATPGWPSHAVVVDRFGTWRRALVAAGFSPPPPHRGGQPQRWTDEELAALVTRYFAEEDQWSGRGLARWLATDPDRPCAGVITQRLGLWPALARLATGAR